MAQILSIYPDEDAHGVAVSRRLAEMNVGEVRLDASRLHELNVYSLDPLHEDFLSGRVFESLTDSSGQSLPRQFDSIYWRRSWLAHQSVALTFPTAPQLATAEACHSLRLALEALPEEFYPLGHPAVLNQQGNKLLQLAAARRAGFLVPGTMVGNDVRQLTEFMRRHPRVVVKPLHASVAWNKENREGVDQLLWCRGMGSAELAGRLASSPKAQLMIQEAVPRKRDWRITVLPHITIGCEINTGHLTEDEPDWRKQSAVLENKIIPMDEAFDRKLRSYLKSLHLKCGYFDFVIDHENRPVFLEVNTNANWLWIEEATGCPISLEVARCLAAGHDARVPRPA